ncbi:unnamed protein product, partial [Ceratitis capitata]
MQLKGAQESIAVIEFYETENLNESHARNRVQVVEKMPSFHFKKKNSDSQTNEFEKFYHNATKKKPKQKFYK